ncbi:outer membrane protein assembly factor BamE [Heyndrickxia sporothermodurans]|uniref:Outer membrane protein assembly factor BamE n=1 Tax=Heyndrickxia sporothermodurans TaxID=46224 RepID=A0A150LCD7_9BACI|nr:outer membrane protein assembly factor BamE [Heyndrickxia sporothermodurans]KYD09636.1 hypothetical protein B4102_2457 [Heyndrickxia sporothermodurans]MBL5769404.1 outer membrane protein assembly factor BamE [Heyndrickxia sporothermodurans]MBL5773188.1 outer membrane protein assembly factor BamE [Heyndrickxia sporothermodurans]MBL5776677.1 outer membrane protein assembly factor BamE [Heyndrickxia sporothermodurans]MBL5787271.1 outer membrane protein assembly factor BamE [Heyndrickxia sporot
MKKVLAIVSIVILSFAIVACGNKEGTVKQDQVDKLKEGMTKSDIVDTLGEPIEKKDNQWTYDLQKNDKTINLHIFLMVMN